jgi:hypothetical protein
MLQTVSRLLQCQHAPSRSRTCLQNHAVIAHFSEFIRQDHSGDSSTEDQHRYPRTRAWWKLWRSCMYGWRRHQAQSEHRIVGRTSARGFANEINEITSG